MCENKCLLLIYVTYPITGQSRSSIFSFHCAYNASTDMAQRCKWKQEDLVRALEDIECNKISFRHAAAKYDIPKSTLCDYVSGKVEVGRKPGPPSVLSIAEEKKLVEYAIEMSRIGYGRTKQQILETVQKILKKDGRENPFRDDKPGNKWWKLFVQRHTELSLRVPEPLQQARALSCTSEAIARWFTDFEQFVDTHDLKDKPHHIWNADESGFPLSPKSGKVVTCSSSRAVYGVTGNTKEQITTLCAVSAAGVVIPPMHIFSGERFRGYNPMNNCVDGAYFGRSQKGWISTELFYGWIANHFTRHVRERPTLLLVDGHACHIDVEVSKFCRDNQIYLYCLPPHTSHVTQPLDVSFFKPLKVAWVKACNSFSLDHPGSFVDKKVFAEIFRNAWIDSVRMSSIVNGFRGSGIYPLNPSAIQPEKLGPSAPYSTSLPKPRPTLNEKSLCDLEALMKPDTVQLYSKRHNEGYDVETDELYLVWSKLKKLTISENSQASFEKEIPIPKSQQNVSTALKEVLTYPHPPSRPQKNGQTSSLPKHLSGDQVVQFLEERQRKKIQEEEDKAKRKEERERKKKEREVEEERKRKEREAKKKGKGRKGKGTATATSTEVRSDEIHSTSSESCAICLSTADGFWPWIACDSCEKWYHAECTDIDPDLYVELDTLDWVCEKCL